MKGNVMRNPKGKYGYLARQRKREIVKTCAYFGISFAIFLMGILSTGSKNNLLTIVAVLGCLPASKSAVSMIMYIKAKGCSPACYDTVKEHENAGIVMYDLYLTSEKKNYQLSSAVVKNNVVCGYTEEPKCDTNWGEKHIADLLRQNDYKNITVKIFGEPSKYVERLKELAGLSCADERRDAGIAKVITDISL